VHGYPALEFVAVGGQDAGFFTVREEQHRQFGAVSVFADFCEDALLFVAGGGGAGFVRFAFGNEAVEQVNQLQAVNMTTGQFLLAAVWSLMNWILDILTLWACVWAVTGITPTFHSDPNNTTVAGVALAFVTSKIVGTIQATPGGLGPVEAALTGTLVAVGMTVVEAFGSVFVYRMVSFVMITLLGWVVYFFTYTRKGLSARDAT